MTVKANQAAFDVGQLAQRLTSAYPTFVAALQVATDPRAMALIPEIEPGFITSVGYISRKDGSTHAFWFDHYLSDAKDLQLLDDFKQAWLGGALIALGDALAVHRYFDHAPELELVYHLRNGVAHGNKFNLTKPGRDQLAKHPAHNRLAWVQSDSKTEFEVTTNLNGQEVLFGFMDPGDVQDLLMSVSLYLIRMGNGDPLRQQP